MEPVKKANHLFKGAFILTAAALFVKLLSAGYRIPFQNIAGDIGFYIYQQIYPFYGIAMALATTGFPVVLSKLYAENKARGARILGASFIILQIFGLICFVTLYFGSAYIAGLMGDMGLIVLLKAVSVVFLLFPAISVLRGYFQGQGDMLPTAVSQIGEQVIRVATILAVAVVFTKEGLSLYYVGAGAMFGAVTGGLVSISILFLFFKTRKSRAGKMPQMLKMDRQDVKKAASALGLQGLAICTASMLMVFIQLGDALNLYSLLVENGSGLEEAKKLKGIFDRGQPLIQLGLTAASTISLSLVPLIASSWLKGDKQFLIHKIRLSMQVTVVIGAGAAAGLYAIAKPANIMLFENSSGTEVLTILSLAIFFGSYITAASAILQARGVLLFPAAAVVSSFPLKYALNVILVPHFGTIGAAWATALSLGIVAGAVGLALKDTIEGSLFRAPFIKRIGAALIIMVVLLKLALAGAGSLDYIGNEREQAALEATAACLAGGLIYIWMIIRSGVFRADELALFPFGNKLALLLPQDRSGNK